MVLLVISMVLVRIMYFICFVRRVNWVLLCCVLWLVILIWLGGLIVVFCCRIEWNDFSLE